MGVIHLVSYMLKNERFFDFYELHGGFLVIDGSSIATRIYSLLMIESCAFGGDFDKYARAVTKFFDDLSKCDVTPIVIGNGGLEKKKLKTHMRRVEEIFGMCRDYEPGSRKFIAPHAMIDVFYSTLKKNKIKVYQCLFEADSSVAGLAKILDCPVLSIDSDFFFYDVAFVQDFTLKMEISRYSKGQGYAMHCKIFKPENLSRVYEGLGKNVFPLVPVLLGNDFVDADVFNVFFHDLDLEADSLNLRGWRHENIHTTLKWLRNYNCLDDAIEAILRKFPETHHAKLLKIIERVINDYRVLRYDMLADLGLENEDTERRKRELEIIKPFVFGGKSVPSGSEISLTEEQIGAFDESRTDEIINDLPSWFLREFVQANLPKYFINILTPRFYIFWNQIEDMNCPSVHSLSFEILRVIHGLLVSKDQESSSDLSVFIRDGSEMSIRKFGKPLEGTATVSFPPLKELRKTDIKVRKLIIDETLGVSEIQKSFEDIPDRWKLYFAVVQFWVENSAEPGVKESHVVAILVSMLFNVIDEKIGYCRSAEEFRIVHGRSKNQVWTRGMTKSRKTLDSLEEALEAVTKEDCLVAAPFIISHFARNEKIDHCPRIFNRNVVHVFTTFQSLCKYFLDLNKLLGQPYENFSFSELFDGTLLYNLSENLARQEKPFEYVALILKQCPSLLNVVTLLREKLIASTLPNNSRSSAEKKKYPRNQRSNDDTIKYSEIFNFPNRRNFFYPF